MISFNARLLLKINREIISYYKTSKGELKQALVKYYFQLTFLAHYVKPRCEILQFRSNSFNVKKKDEFLIFLNFFVSAKYLKW